MDTAELRGALKRLIVETLSLEDVTPEEIEDEAPLFGEGLGLDSLDALELAVACEHAFGVTLDVEQDEVHQALRSVAALADYLAARRAA